MLSTVESTGPEGRIEKKKKKNSPMNNLYLKIIDGIIAARAAFQSGIIFHNSSRLPIRSPRDGSRLARIRCLKRQQHCDEKSSDFQKEREKRVTHWFPLHRHLNHRLDKTEQRMKETGSPQKRKEKQNTLPRSLQLPSLRSTTAIRLNSVGISRRRMETGGKANT